MKYQGPRCCTVMVWCEQSCRSRIGTCANGQSWFPRNLGDPVVSSANPGRRHRVTNSRPRRCTRPPRSEHNEWNRGTAKRRQRSAAGRAAGSRNALIVPLKQGNSPRRTLWRKAKRRPAESIEGNMSNTSRFDQHVTVTRSDSYRDHRGWRTCRLRNRML